MKEESKQAMRELKVILVIIVACLASYFNALFGGFVWDDNILFLPNPGGLPAFAPEPQLSLQELGLARIFSQELGLGLSAPPPLFPRRAVSEHPLVESEWRRWAKQVSRALPWRDARASESE